MSQHADNLLGDLKTVVDRISMLLINERHDHLLKFDENKTRLPKTCRHDIYRHLSLWITSYALRQIQKQFELLNKKKYTGEAIEPCTHGFKKSMGLPCMHLIQKRIDQQKSIPITDVQYHWRYYNYRPTRDLDATPIYDNFPRNMPRPAGVIYVDDQSDADDVQHGSLRDATPRSDHAPDQEPIDPLLFIRDPLRIKPKGRPPGALSKKRTAREAEFEDSTRREPSRFEFSEASRARGRGRGGEERGRGGRGRGRGGERGEKKRI